MMKTITAAALKKKIDAKEDFVLVFTLPESYFEKKHIPGSICIPTDTIEEKALQTIQDLDKEVIVYCANTQCQASPRAARKLEALGFKHVIDFEDGLQGWEDAGYPVE